MGWVEYSAVRGVAAESQGENEKKQLQVTKSWASREEVRVEKVFPLGPRVRNRRRWSRAHREWR